MIQPAVSVIITSYNAARTLPRALDSILGQTLSDFEILVCDDGSTDGTPEVIRQYEGRNSRIRGIRLEHQGVAAARQAGIDAAKGEFTIFVDADDWIEPDMLDALVLKARQEHADLVICDMRIIRNHGTELSVQDPGEATGKELIPLLFNRLHGSLCNKLIRRECYRKYGIGFLPGLNCCEDLLVVLKLLDAGATVTYVPKAFYQYDKTGESITNHWTDVPVREKVRFLEEAAPIADRNKASASFNDYLAKIAYNAVLSSREACPDYASFFRPFRKRILSSTLPFRKKGLIRLCLTGLRLPLRALKLRRINKQKQHS